MMPEKQIQENEIGKASPGARGDAQYQHQTLVLNNTAGVFFMSILAFILLAALLRQHKLYRDLVEKLGRE